MDLGYTEFQELLRQAAREFVEREGLVRGLRELVERRETFDEPTWQKMAALGWCGLLVPEQYGGSGGRWADMIVLLEELGRGLAPQHLLSHILAGLAIAAYGTEAQRQALLPEVAHGQRRFSLAITEPRATLDPAGIQCRAAEEAGAFVLRGTKHFVRGGSSADVFVVVARLEDRPALFLVDRAAPGLLATPLPNIGHDDLVRLDLTNVRIPPGSLLGGETHGWTVLRAILDWGALLECGYALGLMAKDAEMTVHYVKDRTQFGRPIGSFQAVQHQVADQVTDVDISRFLTFYGAWALDEGLPTASTAISRAKAWVSDALRRVVRTGNQLHGGIGFSKEYDLHLYYQRAKTCELMFGTADDHRELVAVALLDG